MEKQFHVLYKSEELNPESFRPVVNRQFVKAGGGLFTSTYNEEYGSDWVQWCLGNDFCVPEAELWTGYILTPSIDAKVLTVDSFDDLHKVHKEYKSQVDGPPAVQDLLGRYLDFEQMAKDYDAFHVTQKGEWATRYTHPLSKFDDMKKIEKVRFESDIH
jgi:hypothetical protein